MFKTFIMFILVIILLYYKHSNQKLEVDDIPLDTVIINRPTSTVFKNNISNNRLSIFTDVLHNININNIYSHKTRRDSIFKFFKQFHEWNTIVYNFKLIYKNKGDYSPIQSVSNDVYLKTIITGTKKMLIFNKTHTENIQKYITGGVNIWDDLHKNTTPYFEIILYDGNMIYIPSGWLYTEYSMTDTISIENKSNLILKSVMG